MRALAKLDLISIGLWGSLWLISYLVWPHVPREIPTHWSLDGTVDGASSRAFALVFVPLLCTMLVGLMTLFVRAVWVKDSESVERTFRRVRQGVLALFAVLHIALVMAALGGALDIARVGMTATGILLAYVGLLLPKIPRNRWFGIRTRATLADEKLWKKANRTGSWALVLAGITTVLAAFLPPTAQLCVLILTVFAAATVSILGALRGQNSSKSESGKSPVAESETDSATPA